MAENVPEVSIQHTLEDYLGLSRRIRRELSSRYKPITYVVYAVGLFALLILPSLLNDVLGLPLPPAFALTVVVLVTLYGIIASEIQRRASANMFDARGSFFRSSHLAAEEKGLRVTSELTDSFFNWKAFLRIEETNSHIYLFTDKNAAIIVPRRCFVSEKAQADFTSLVRRETRLID